MVRKKVGSEIICGIYCIQNRINHKRYVGSSKDIYARWLRHINSLNKGEHHSSHLQKSWNKYGQENFDFFILQRCNEYERFQNEQIWYDYYDVSNKEYGYNCSPIAIAPNVYRTIDDLKNGRCIISFEEFSAIINYLCNTTLSIPEISKIVGIPSTNIYAIYFRENYSRITKDLVFLQRSHCTRNILSDDDVQIIVDKLLHGIHPNDIANQYGVSSNTINDIKFHRSWKQYTDGIIFPDVHRDRNISYVRVDQYDKIGHFLCTFNSMHEASMGDDILYKNISACCNGSKKSAGGYIWRKHGEPLDKYPLPSF